MVLFPSPKIAYNLQFIKVYEVLILLVNMLGKVLHLSSSNESNSTSLFSFYPPITNKLLSGEGDNNNPPNLCPDLNGIISAIKFFS